MFSILVIGLPMREVLAAMSLGEEDNINFDGVNDYIIPIVVAIGLGLVVELLVVNRWVKNLERGIDNLQNLNAEHSLKRAQRRIDELEKELTHIEALRKPNSQAFTHFLVGSILKIVLFYATAGAIGTLASFLFFTIAILDTQMIETRILNILTAWLGVLSSLFYIRGVLSGWRASIIYTKVRRFDEYCARTKNSIKELEEFTARKTQA